MLLLSHVLASQKIVVLCLQCRSFKIAGNVPVIGAVACVAPAAGNCAYHVLCAVISIC